MGGEQPLQADELAFVLSRQLGTAVFRRPADRAVTGICLEALLATQRIEVSALLITVPIRRLLGRRR
jgi:hypothetical protein